MIKFKIHPRLLSLLVVLFFAINNVQISFAHKNFKDGYYRIKTCDGRFSVDRNFRLTKFEGDRFYIVKTEENDNLHHIFRVKEFFGHCSGYCYKRFVGADYCDDCGDLWDGNSAYSPESKEVLTNCDRCLNFIDTWDIILVDMDTGLHRLRLIHPNCNLALDVKNKRLEEGNELRLYPRDSADSQKFILKYCGKISGFS